MKYEDFKKGMTEIAEIVKKFPEDSTANAFDYLVLALVKGNITPRDLDMFPFQSEDYDDFDEFDDDYDDDELFDKN